MEKSKKNLLITASVGIVGLLIGLVVFLSFSLLISENAGKETQEVSISPTEHQKCEPMLAKFQEAVESGVEEGKLKEMYAAGQEECPNHFPTLEEDIEMGGDDSQPSPPNPTFKSRVANKFKLNKRVESNENENNSSNTGNQVRENESLPTNNTNNATKPKPPAENHSQVHKRLFTPQELKQERSKVLQENDFKIKSFVLTSTHTLSNLFNNYSYVKDHYDRISQLSKQGVLPDKYEWYDYLVDYLKTGILKAAKDQNKAEAQKLYDIYFRAVKEEHIYESREQFTLRPKDTSNAIDLNDYKFWTAIAKADWNMAANLLDSGLLLPEFLCQTLKSKAEKLKIFKDLSEKQMEAFLNYLRMNMQREKYLDQYLRQSSNEELMIEAADKYRKVVQQMELLNSDIHPQFDFAVPLLLEKKSKLQEIELYCKDKGKLSQFDEAWTALTADDKRSMKLILQVVLKLLNQSDQLHVLELFKAMKHELSVEADVHLIDALLAYIKENVEEINVNMRKTLIALEKSFQKDFEPLGGVLDVLFAKPTTNEMLKTTIQFWKFVTALVQKESKVDTQEGRLNLSNIAQMSYPDKIDFFGQFGDADNTRTSAKWIHLRANLPKATVAHKLQDEYAMAYMEIFEAMKGKDMYKLWSFDKSIRRPYFESVPVKVIASLVQSKENYEELCGVTQKKAFYAEIRQHFNSKLFDPIRVIKPELALPFELQYFTQAVEILKDPKVNVSNLQECLKAAAINSLLNFLKDNFYCDYKTATGTTVETVTKINELYSDYKRTEASAAVKPFVDAATRIINDMKDDLFTSQYMTVFGKPFPSNK